MPRPHTPTPGTGPTGEGGPGGGAAARRGAPAGWPGTAAPFGPGGWGPGDGDPGAGRARPAGAETVAELMVGATAWMVLIKGQTTFTRRDVFTVFDTMPGNHSKSLEARLNGCGRAARAGQRLSVEHGDDDASAGPSEPGKIVRYVLKRGLVGFGSPKTASLTRLYVRESLLSK